MTGDADDLAGCGCILILFAILGVMAVAVWSVG